MEETTIGPSTSWLATTLAAYPGSLAARGRPGGVGNLLLRRPYQKCCRGP